MAEQYPYVLQGNPKWSDYPPRRKDFKPWADDKDVSTEVKEVSGNIYEMRTPNGGQVFAWVPDENAKGRLRYYCHGIGLRTYDPQNEVGYTITSTSVHHVLADPACASCIVPAHKDPKVAPRNQYNILEFVAQSTEVSKLPVPEQLAMSSAPDDLVITFNIQKEDVLTWWDEDPDQSAVNRFWFGSTLLCMHTAIILQPVFVPAKAGNGVQWFLSDESIVLSKNGAQILKDCSLGDVKNQYKAHPTIAVYRLCVVPRERAHSERISEAMYQQQLADMEKELITRIRRVSGKFVEEPNRQKT